MRPFNPDISTSVSSRSMWPRWRAAISSAWSPAEASCTENPRERVRVHSGSRVADLHLDIVAGLERRVRGNADLVELDVPQFDGDPAAARHSVAGVDHEVHQYLFNLRRVRQDRREIGPHV